MTAARERTAFRQVLQVSADIKARPGAVWSRLTNAAGFPAWNWTVESIDGLLPPTPIPSPLHPGLQPVCH